MTAKPREFGCTPDISGYSNTVVRYANTHSYEDLDLTYLVLKYHKLSYVYTEKEFITFSDRSDFRVENNGEDI